MTQDRKLELERKRLELERKKQELAKKKEEIQKKKEELTADRQRRQTSSTPVAAPSDLAQVRHRLTMMSAELQVKKSSLENQDNRPQ